MVKIKDHFAHFTSCSHKTTILNRLYAESQAFDTVWALV